MKKWSRVGNAFFVAFAMVPWAASTAYAGTTSYSLGAQAATLKNPSTDWSKWAPQYGAMFHQGSGQNELDFLLLHLDYIPLNAVVYGNLPRMNNDGSSLCVQEILRDVQGPFDDSDSVAATPYVCLEGNGPVDSSAALGPFSYTGSELSAAMIAVWASGEAEVDTIVYEIASSP
jgi:hypothetical protein